MTVDRTATAFDPAILSIHFAPADAQQTSDSATSSPAPTDSTTQDSTPSDHDPTERVRTIDMTKRTNLEILQEFQRITKAYPIEPTAEEREELRSLEEHRMRSERDRNLSQEVRARQKREEELLEQARGDVASQAA